jgi:hypothetical protein
VNEIEIEIEADDRGVKVSMQENKKSMDHGGMRRAVCGMYVGAMSNKEA